MADRKIIVANSRPRCPSCPHFHRDNAAGGHCRRYPPTVLMVPQQTIKGVEILPNSVWPPTQNDRFCGEHPDFIRWFSENRERAVETAGLDQAEAQTA
jgi:hypothetical protein